MSARYWIVDKDGRRQRNSKDRLFTERLKGSRAAISFYFDMGYGDEYTIVDAATSQPVETRTFDRDTGDTTVTTAETTP